MSPAEVILMESGLRLPPRGAASPANAPPPPAGDVNPDPLGIMAYHEALANEPPPPPPPAPPAGVLRTMADMGIKVGQGAVDLGQAAVGAASLATGGLAGKAMRSIGYDPERTNQALAEYLSPSQREAEKNVQQADGFVDTLVAAAKNPRALAGQVAESLPGMLSIGGLTKAVATRIALRAAAPLGGLGTEAGAKAAQEAVEAAAGKLMWASGGAQGVQTAGQVADQAQAAGREYADYAGPAVAAGAGTALLTRGAGALVGDPLTAIASGAEAAGPTGNVATRIAKGVVSQGALQQAPQAAGQTLATNVALGKDDPLEGVGAQAALGMATGTAMGIGEGAISPHAAAAKVRATEKVPEVGVLSAAANMATEAKAQGIESAAPVEPAPAASPAVDAIVERIKRMQGQDRIDAAHAYSVVQREDVPKGVKQFNSKLLDRLLNKQELAEAPGDTTPKLGYDPTVGKPTMYAGEEGAATTDPNQRVPLLTHESDPTGVLRADEAGNVVPETRAAAIDTAQAQGVIDAEAQRKAEIGLTPDVEAAQVRATPAAEERVTELAIPAPAAARPGDIMTKAGAPFSNRLPALNAARRAGEDHEVVPVEGGFVVRKKSDDWQKFPEQAGSLGIPRAEMPQIKSENHGPLVNFLNARGIDHEIVDVEPRTLKPTQDEFSISKAEAAQQFEGERSILVSSDNHVLDGHHQWLAAGGAGEPVKAIRLNAPAKELLTAIKEFPSAKTTEEQTKAAEQPAVVPAAKADTAAAEVQAARNGAAVAAGKPGKPDAALKPPKLGKEVSRDIGVYKEGMSEARATQRRSELARQNPGVHYAVETDESLKHGYVVVGRKLQTKGKDDTMFSRRADRRVNVPPAVIAGELAYSHNHADYAAAKGGDTDAAIRLAHDLVTDAYAEKVRELIGKEKPVLVPVAAVETTGKNKIPAAVAHALAAKLGLTVDDEIVQSRKVGRSEMDGLDRIFTQPEFDGAVKPGQKYLLVDDTLTQGGTFAALASHIEQGGGEVVGAAALTGKQYSARITPSAETLQKLRSKHGDIEQDFRAATGYGFDALTESEARYLANYRPADAVRARILAERQQAGPGEDAQAFRGPVAEDGTLTPLEIQTEVSSLTGSWLRKPEIHVLDSMDDAPARVREIWQQQNSQGGSGAVEGFHYKGGVYLLADMIGSKEDVARVLFHEALGHFGLRNVFGDTLNPILKQVAALRAGEVRAKAEQYGLDMNKPAERLMAAEEVLAEMAQTRPEIGYVQRAIAAIRTWLRENVPGFKDMELSDDEIVRNYLQPARGFVERGREAMPRQQEDAPAFSRATDTIARAKEVAAVKEVSEAWDGLKRFSAPQYRTDAAREVARTLIEGMGEKEMQGIRFRAKLNRAIVENDKTLTAAEKARDLIEKGLTVAADKVFLKQSADENHAFMQAMDTGDEKYFAEHPELKGLADVIGKMFTDKAKEVQDLDTGAMQAVRENYFPHIWDREPSGDAQREIFTTLSKRPLEGQKGFSKARVFEDVKAGLDAGFKPLSSNPLDLVALKMEEMDKYILAHKTLRALEGSDGVHLIGAGEKTPQGFTDVNGRFGNIERNGEKLRYVARDDVAQVINNYLSPSLYHNKYVGKMFTGYMGAANTLNQFQLGVFSAFHAGFTSFEAVISHASIGVKALTTGDFKGAAKYLGSAPAAWINNPKMGSKIIAEMLAKGTHPEMASIIEGLQMAGFKWQMDNRFRTDATKKMLASWGEGKKAAAAFHSIGAIAEQSARPILEWLVPRQKFGVFGEMYSKWMHDNPNATHEELRNSAQQIWNRVDSRLGQVVYDRLFVHNVAKNFSQMLIRAPGWTGGTILEVGGGIKDLAKYAADLALGKKPAGITDRAAYTLSMLMVTAMANAALTAMFTGQAPEDWKDLVAFRSGNLDEHGRPERFMLPTYMKDLVAYARAPGTTLVNKSHPLLSLVGDVVRNKDFQGTEIRSEDDNIFTQLAETAGFAAKAFVPFWVKGVEKENEREGSDLAKAAPLLGVMPASADFNKSPAERLMSEYGAERAPQGSRTAEEAAKAQLRQKMYLALRKGESSQAMDIYTAGNEKGVLGPRDYLRAVRQSQNEPLVNSFQHLTFEQAARVMKLASDDEKEKLAPLFARKEAEHEREHPETVE